jgi:hypothetical protein
MLNITAFFAKNNPGYWVDIPLCGIYWQELKSICLEEMTNVEDIDILQEHLFPQCIHFITQCIKKPVTIFFAGLTHQRGAAK